MEESLQKEAYLLKTEGRTVKGEIAANILSNEGEYHGLSPSVSIWEEEEDKSESIADEVVGQAGVVLCQIEAHPVVLDVPVVHGLVVAPVLSEEEGVSRSVQFFVVLDEHSVGVLADVVG